MAFSDLRGARFCARLALGTALGWMYRSDLALRSPYSTNLAAPIHTPIMERLTDPAIVAKANLVGDRGNRAWTTRAGLDQYRRQHDGRHCLYAARTDSVRRLFG